MNLPTLGLELCPRNLRPRASSQSSSTIRPTLVDTCASQSLKIFCNRVASKCLYHKSNDGMPSYGQETVIAPAQDGLSLAEKCLIELSFSTRILTIIPPRIPRLAFRRAYLTAWRGNINSCVTSMRDDIPLCSPISTYLCGVALILCLSIHGCRVFSFLAVILFLVAFLFCRYVWY